MRLEEREFFIDNLFRIHCTIVMTKLTGLALCEFEFPFPGSLTSTFLDAVGEQRVTSQIIENTVPWLISEWATYGVTSGPP